MGEFRQAALWCLIGGTGSGKTSLLVELLKYFRKNKNYSKIIGSDPHGVMGDAKLLDHDIEPGDEYWAKRLMSKDKYGRYRFYGSLLAMDDYRSLLGGSHTPKHVLALLMLRRRISMDIIYVTHNPKLVLEQFTYYTNMYSIFYTESSSSDFSDKIPNYESCQKAAKLINKYVVHLGGVDSDAYRKLYPNFPHIFVETKSKDLKFMNMKQSIIDEISS